MSEKMVYESHKESNKELMQDFDEQIEIMIDTVIKKGFANNSPKRVPPMVPVYLYYIENEEHKNWNPIFYALSNCTLYKKLFEQKLNEYTNGEFCCNFRKCYKSDIVDTYFPEERKNHRNKTAMWVVNIFGNSK